MKTFHILLVPSLALQLGQSWWWSARDSMQKGMKQHPQQPLQPFRGCLIFSQPSCVHRCWSSFSKSEAYCPIISYWTSVVGIICPKKEPLERSLFVKTYPKKQTAAQITHCITLVSLSTMDVIWMQHENKNSLLKLNTFLLLAIWAGHLDWMFPKSSYMFTVYFLT